MWAWALLHWLHLYRLDRPTDRNVIVNYPRFSVCMLFISLILIQPSRKNYFNLKRTQQPMGWMVYAAYNDNADVWVVLIALSIYNWMIFGILTIPLFELSAQCNQVIKIRWCFCSSLCAFLLFGSFLFYRFVWAGVWFLRLVLPDRTTVYCILNYYLFRFFFGIPSNP